MIEDPINAARIAILASGLLYASYEDWTVREVNDLVWILCGAAAGALTIVNLAYGWDPGLATLLAISIGLSVGLAFAFYFLGLYGGADAKAIALVSVGLPLYYPPARLHPFTGLATLSNGLILSLGLLLVFFFWNLVALARGEKIFEGFEHEGRLRKLAAMFLGIRARDARRRKFWFPLEAERDGKRFFDFKLLSLELEELDRDDCWITPGIPLLIFITAGFLTYVFVGDILEILLKLLL